MTNLKNSNGDKTQKLILWKNPRTQIVTKLKKTQIVRTQIVTKLKLWHYSNWDKTQILQSSNCDQKKTQIVTKLKNSNSDKTRIMTNLNLWQEKYSKWVFK